MLYMGLIVFFAYFYTAIVFNPVDLADNMKKYGGFIPGVRPGKKTRSTSTTCSRASRCRARSSWP
jgi:preprotein translocase subunit SecY